MLNNICNNWLLTRRAQAHYAVPSITVEFSDHYNLKITSGIYFIKCNLNFNNNAAQITAQNYEIKLVASKNCLVRKLVSLLFNIKASTMFYQFINSNTTQNINCRCYKFCFTLSSNEKWASIALRSEICKGQINVSTITKVSSALLRTANQG